MNIIIIDKKLLKIKYVTYICTHPIPTNRQHKFLYPIYIFEFKQAGIVFQVKKLTL